MVFPEIGYSVIQYLEQRFGKSQTLSDLLQLPGYQEFEKSQTLSDLSEVKATGFLTKKTFTEW